MAGARPTINSLIQALGQKNIKSLEDAISCIEPQSGIDVIEHGPETATKTKDILNVLLSFPPPADKNTYRRLSRAMIDSGLVRANREDIPAGLTGLICQGLDNDKNEWISEIMEMDFHAMFRAYTNGGFSFQRWILKIQNTALMEQVSEFAMRAMRYKGLSQNSLDARKILDLLEFVLDIDSELLSVRKTDLAQFKHLERKAEVPHPRLLSFLHNKTLFQMAHGFSKPAASAPKI